MCDKLAVDGKFGNITDSWVCQFQIAAGLEEDGIVGAKTRDMMKKYQKKA